MPAFTLAPVRKASIQLSLRPSGVLPRNSATLTGAVLGDRCKSRCRRNLWKAAVLGKRCEGRPQAQHHGGQHHDGEDERRSHGGRDADAGDFETSSAGRRQRGTERRLSPVPVDISPNDQRPNGQPFSSRLSSFTKRQSVPLAMILPGVDLIMPASRSRSA